MPASSKFSITKTYDVKGGPFCKNKRTIQDVISFGGMDFVPLTYKNRNVVDLLKTRSAKKGATERWPLGLLTTLRHARNNHVDALIKEHLRAGDPMCEADAQVSSLSAKERILLFHEARVPPTIKITMPAFSTDSGEHVEPFNLTMLSTHKKQKQIHLELTEDNFTWLSYACNRTYAHEELVYDSDEENQKIDSFRHLVPHDVHLGTNPKKPTSCDNSWFLRRYINRKLVQVTFSMSNDETDEEIKARLEVALANLQKKIEKKTE